MSATPQGPYLIVPGYLNSEADHWQTQWEATLPQARRVIQRSWTHPDPDAWVATLAAAIAACPQPPVVVAHSLGVTTLARWAHGGGHGIAGAFLVAAPDLEHPALPTACRAGAPYELRPFHFTSVLIAADNDPYCSLKHAQTLAEGWGSDFINAGARGHINADSGHGAWPEGLALLEIFVNRLGRRNFG